MLTFRIREGIFTSDSLMLVHRRVVDKRYALYEETKSTKRRKNAHNFNTKTITFNLPPPPSPAPSCSTDETNTEEPCMLCGLPEDDPTDKVCKLCTDFLANGLAEVVTVPAALVK
jgi:hypothetical protein